MKVLHRLRVQKKLVKDTLKNTGEGYWSAEELKKPWKDFVSAEGVWCFPLY